jgi:hypothetical protein
MSWRSEGGGRVVSIVSSEPPPQKSDVQVLCFYAEVTTSRLEILNTLFEKGTISAHAGSVLPLAEAREAHLMLAVLPISPVRSSCSCHRIRRWPGFSLAVLALDSEKELANK